MHLDIPFSMKAEAACLDEVNSRRQIVGKHELAVLISNRGKNPRVSVDGDFRPRA